MTLIHDDCVSAMREMPEDSVDAICTDPPYGLSFMNKDFDKLGESEAMQAWHEAWAREALRVLKPGGFLLAFGGTRTVHRLTCAIEDAGFEIRDSITWIYASGFPKSLDVSKAIDKMGGRNISWFAPWLKAERKKRGLTAKALAEHFKTSPERINHGGCVSNWELGLNVPTVEQFNKLCDVLDLPFERLEEVEREVVGKSPNGFGPNTGASLTHNLEAHPDITAPATEAAKQWEGFGTALKPAHEIIVCARKPLSESSVARNVLAHGTGALNIDGSRVGNDSTLRNSNTGTNGEGWGMGKSAHVNGSSSGRWPANVILSHSSECQRVGVKRVRGSNIGGNSGTRGNEVYGKFGESQMGVDPGYTDPDGFEEVEAWECVEGCPVAELDRQSGPRKAGGKVAGTEPSRTGQNGIYGHWNRVENSPYNDQGGASRFFKTFEGEPGFFYCAKSSRSERNAFTKSLPRTKNKRKRYQQDRSGRWLARVVNKHPTVKPLALMRYLVKLVCPPGGVVLDLFAGSFTTGVACAQVGFDFIGIEKESEYFEIGNRRVAWALSSCGTTGKGKSDCQDDWQSQLFEIPEKGARDALV